MIVDSRSSIEPGSPRATPLLLGLRVEIGADSDGGDRMVNMNAMVNVGM
jgi:hypothetical protein